jgi:segregation and condensation protein B
MTTHNQDHSEEATPVNENDDNTVAENSAPAPDAASEELSAPTANLSATDAADREARDEAAPDEGEPVKDEGAFVEDDSEEEESEVELLLTGNIEDEDEDTEDEDLIIHDADAEDEAAEVERRLAEMRAEAKAEEAMQYIEGDVAPGGGQRGVPELMAMAEALIYVSDEPLTIKTLADVLDEEYGWVLMAVEELAKEFNERNSGLMLREVAGGWQIVTRPEYHEQIRAFLRSRPSAKLSLAALETLAVIAYKQPITVPEILEIRGVQSSSAIKTLLDKRLIVAKGRKETVGRPMLYGTSKEFLMQFGLRDLSELPSIEDFEDLAGGAA